MLPPLAASLFGDCSPISSPPLAGVHLAAVFFGLYTAHVKDGYVDFYGRGGTTTTLSERAAAPRAGRRLRGVLRLHGRPVRAR